MPERRAQHIAGERIRASRADDSATSFTADFSALAALKPLVAQGKGKVGVLLPETTTSARYTSFDAPYLQKAFEAAGLTPDQYIITNARAASRPS